MVVAVSGECLFKDSASDKVLNLTSYITALEPSEHNQCSMQGCSGCGYVYSPCRNGAFCESKLSYAMAIKNALGSGKCEAELAMYDESVLPVHTAANNSWTFTYHNGKQCATDPTRNYDFTVQFYCTNDTWPQADTGPTSNCSYLMKIGSMYTC